MSKILKGIDVSDNQGAIDHTAVSAAGCDFVILRSTRGSGKEDKRFAENLAGFLAVGLPVDVYKYAYATTVIRSRDEASLVVELLRTYDHKCKVWWDVEYAAFKLLGSTRLTACIRVAKEVIESAGYEFGIYTGQNVIKENWFDHNSFNCDFWIARYPLDNQSTEKSLSVIPPKELQPNVTIPVKGWQWTSKGTVPGISGNVDLDVFYGDFRSAEEYYPLPKIANVFQAEGLPHSYSDRKRLANINGLASYTGKVEENMYLMALWIQGNLKMV